MEDFLQKLFSKYESQITDNIFCYIEKDKDLMKAYLDLVADKGNLQYINSHIAQEITKRYRLNSIPNQIGKPKSNLIQSFTELVKTI